VKLSESSSEYGVLGWSVHPYIVLRTFYALRFTLYALRLTSHLYAAENPRYAAFFCVEMFKNGVRRDGTGSDPDQITAPSALLGNGGVSLSLGTIAYILRPCFSHYCLRHKESAWKQGQDRTASSLRLLLTLERGRGALGGTA
jgi:hypothetical protein